MSGRSPGALDRRLHALAEAAELASGRLDGEAVEAAQAIVRRAGERLGHGLEATVAALAGPTGAGKSTLFNALAGRELVAAGVRRPTTGAATAAVWDAPAGDLLDWLEVPARHSLDGGGPAGLVLLDLPDFDSVEASHRIEVDRILPLVDLLVWVVDPQKYADAALHERYLRPLARHAPAMLVVLNHADRLGEQVPAAREDLRRLLGAEGLGDVPVLAVSGRTGAGLDALREALTERVRMREAALRRLEADVGDAVERLRAVAGTGRPQPPGRAERDELVAALARAAGLPAVVTAVARAHRRRGALAAGLPWLRWLRRLRPDPLERLRLGDVPQEEVRTSLPRATAVQRAQVDSALRTLAAGAAGDLPDPWPQIARRAATARQESLADELDRAIAGAGLRVTRPRWWTVAGLAQKLLAGAAAAGALWLLVLAGLAWLQLDDVLGTPEVGGIPLPTALLGGGLLAGAVLAFLAGRVNSFGARRRAARARRALSSRIAAVAGELVLDPLADAIGAHARLAAKLDEAAGTGRRARRRAAA